MRRLARWFACVGLLLGAGLPLARAAEAVPFRVCANDALGKLDNNNSAHVLARTALARVPELRVQMALLPWQRCLSDAANGQFDAVLAASYTAQRAQSLAYPLNAQGEPDASRRMFQVGYVLLKRKDSPVLWDGERFHHSSARPGEAIGAERGYSIVLFARDRGAVVEDRFPSYGSLIESLRIGRTAGVLINQEGAISLLSDAAWRAELEMSGPPITPKAYYLPVSHAFQAAHPELTERLWTTLAAARQEPAFRTLFSQNLTAGRRKDLLP